ncbi:hypothetical protein CRENBAI_020955 [Crenichthys baileyi]|uniref:Uncharacterized protein n=1 Tax=Crenichthys baileyi TaxID=28760 RepID=A0AAV9RIK0_9TELE
MRGRPSSPGNLFLTTVHTPLPASPGEPKAFPGQPRDIVPSSVSWGRPLGLIPVGRPRNTSRGRRPGGIQYRCPSHLNCSSRCGEQRLYSEPLPDGRAPHPISKGVPGHPYGETHFSRLYPGSHSFGNDPKFMAIGEGRNRDQPVNRELRFSAQLSLHHNGPAQCPLTEAATPIRLSISRSILPSFVNKTPRTLASDLEELIFSQPLHTRLRTTPRICRSWLEGASRTMHLQKEETKNHFPPKPNPLRPLAASRNPIQQSYEQDRSTRLAPWLISSWSQFWASGKHIKNSYTPPAKVAEVALPPHRLPSLVPGPRFPQFFPSIFIPQTISFMILSGHPLLPALCFGPPPATSAFPLSPTS